jgi:hypothetical protein
MKRLLLVGAMLMSFVLGGVAAKSATSGTPEVDNANATIDVSSRLPLKQIGCAGEDASDYETLTGMWASVETETIPGLTDYPLSGRSSSPQFRGRSS